MMSAVDQLAHLVNAHPKFPNGEGAWRRGARQGSPEHAPARESLTALHGAVSAAAAGEREAVRSLTAAYRAFVAFYRSNPRDLSLGFYLFEGAGPRGLNAKLDRDLNERFLGVMQIFEACLASTGVRPRERKIEAVALFNEMVGLLMAANTGRLVVFGVDADTMIDRHVAWLQKRVALLVGHQPGAKRRAGSGRKRPVL